MLGNYQYSLSEKLYYGSNGSSIVSLKSLKGPTTIINTPFGGTIILTTAFLDVFWSAFAADFVVVGDGVWVATQTYSDGLHVTGITIAAVITPTQAKFCGLPGKAWPLQKG